MMQCLSIMTASLLFCLIPSAVAQENVAEDADLQKAVAQYIDQLIAVRGAPVTAKRPSWSTVCDQFTWQRAVPELFRQAKVRNSDYLYGEILGSELAFDDIREAALRGLDSANERYRDRSLIWCSRHSDLLNDGQKKEVRAILTDNLKATKGEKLEHVLRFAKFGTKDDLPWLRKMYQDHFFEREPNYSAAKALPGYATVTRSRFLLLLAQLCDESVKTEIAVAIGQDKNLDQRVWGIFMATNLKDRTLVPLIGKTLDDKRQAPEPIEEWKDPDAKGPHLWRVSYHRVCDVALRAIWTLDKPKEKWPFKMPPMSELGTGWVFLHGMSNSLFDYVEPLRKEANQQRGLFLNHVILGYTDEQLEQVRGYMKTRAAAPSAKQE